MAQTKKKTSKKAPLKKKSTAKKKTRPVRKKKTASQSGSVKVVEAEVLDPVVSSPAGEKDSVESFESPTSSSGVTKMAPPEVSASSGALTRSDPVTTYLAEIRRYPLLSKEEEKEIAMKYHESKDPALAEALVTSNLRFVVKVAAEYAKFGAKLIDLIQEGNVGLMHAVKEFNPYKGVRLITYAVWWIRGYIQEYLMRQYSMVRIGTTQAQRKLFYQLQKERQKLENEGIVPTSEILSDRLGVAEKDVKMMTQRLSGRDVSLDQPLDSDSDSSRMLDFQESGKFEPGVDEQLSQMELLEKLLHNIEKVKPSLSEKETFILEKRMLADEPMTLQEVGDHYGVTREAVRQMEARLMNKIKNVFLEDIIELPGETASDSKSAKKMKDIN